MCSVQTLIQPLNSLISNMEAGMSVSVHRWWDQVSDAKNHVENSVRVYSKLQPPSAFLLKTLFTGAFAESEEKGS